MRFQEKINKRALRTVWQIPWQQKIYFPGSYVTGCHGGMTVDITYQQCMFVNHPIFKTSSPPHIWGEIILFAIKPIFWGMHTYCPVLHHLVIYTINHQLTLIEGYAVILCFRHSSLFSRLEQSIWPIWTTFDQPCGSSREEKGFK